MGCGGSKKEKSIILTGYVGKGKTNIFKKICSCRSQAGKFEQPQKSAYGKRFLVYNTPVLGDYSREIAHTIKSVLEKGPLNQIVIVIKAEEMDIMKNQLDKIINQQYKRFKNMISVFVIHLNRNKGENIEEKKQQEKISDMVKTTFHIKSVFFIQEQTTGKEICNLIDRILIQQKEQHIKLTLTELYSVFDFTSFKEDFCDDKIEEQLMKAKEKVTIEFRKYSIAVKKFIKDFNSNHVIMPEVMSTLTQEIKKFTNQSTLKFEQQKNELFSKLFDEGKDMELVYLMNIELKNELMMEEKILIELIQKKMSVSSQRKD